MKSTKLILLTLGLLIVLTACKDAAAEPEVWHYELSVLETGSAELNIVDTAVTEDSVYVLAYDESYSSGIYLLDREGRSLNRLCDTGAAAIAPDRNGGIWLLEITYDEQTETSAAKLGHMNAEGEITKETDIPAELSYASGMETDGEGRLYILDFDRLLLLDTEGELCGEIKSAGYVHAIASTAKGGVLVYDSGEKGLCEVDFDKQCYGEIYETETELLGLIGGFGDNDFCYYNNDGVYAKGAESEELLWLDSGISGPRHCTAVDEETLLVSENGALLLTKTPGERPDDKTRVTLATMGLHQSVESAIVQFNRISSEYQVELIDYGVYNSFDGDRAGLLKLSTEIVSGRVPDIIDLGGMSIGSLADKGVLLELDGLMSGLDGLLPNISQAARVEGKLYSVIPAFQVSTAVGLTSRVGDRMGWTYGDFVELLEQSGSLGFANMTQTEVFELILSATLSRFVDGRDCGFTSEGFISLLELAASYPAEIDQSRYTSEVVQLGSGSALLSAMTLKNGLTYTTYETILGGDLSFVGFPTADGTGSNGVVPLAELAIGATGNTDGAWAFLSYLLSEKVQEGITGGFPVSESALGSLLEGYGDLGYASGYFGTTIDGEEVEIELKPLSPAAIEKYRQLIGSLDTVRRDDNELAAIALEEAQLYFAGEKSAAETAENIQNRAGLYLEAR